ncbi:hypothetical protein M378DRAFT_71609 [Amanita muscaria Koide BX008]|uniref:PPM-type phosphatase domain-containing protein n=1 Tax=Amanita muscaria (strain Koide BX008) TaxID=946122 RepID=A0A0C2X2V0_AMAMK|nr:hypothetical protein M378DRAFT_71609 [Amanita muscaria Koide BX008]
MLIHSSYAYAYPKDIPGSRCDPDEGPWPRPYRVLQEDEMWREFARLAKPQSAVFNPKQPHWRADSVNFQPSPRSRTQDRYIVTQLDIHGCSWTFSGVFDGHLGDATVEHVAHHLPIIVRDFLRQASEDLRSHQAAEPHCKNSAGFTPELVSNLFSRSIIAFDDAIANDVLELFGGLEGLQNFSNAEIRNIINDQHNGGANWKKARLCMYGTTALVALVDPGHKNMWVANLGDCQAILVTPKDDIGIEWNVETLNEFHNGDNDAEVDRVQRQHPNEPESVVDRRVLGALAPFRCLGDVPFKQPPEFTRRILYNLLPGFHNVSPWEEFLVRNLTPPYITAEPDVIHRSLEDCIGTPSLNGVVHGKQRLPRFLILASDGFGDLCGNEESQARIVQKWASSVVTRANSESWHSALSKHKGLGTPLARASENLALSLLRRTLGEDAISVSRVLTLDMETSWIDDTAVVVQTL